jgi:hypothetical protein
MIYNGEKVAACFKDVKKQFFPKIQQGHSLIHDC